MTTTKITREQYMANSSELHNAYYLQFATPATFQFVRSVIGLERLRKSKCKHFNDIGIKHRYSSQIGCSTWLWDSAPVNVALCRELGEGCSLSTHTCVGKAAARHIIDNE